MVASAETEPGSSWLYEWMSVFSEANVEKRNDEPIEVAERIIDTFPANEGNNRSDTTGLTLAVYDLSKADELRTAFESIASELYATLDNIELFSQISRRAEKVSSMCAGSHGLYS